MAKLPYKITICPDQPNPKPLTANHPSLVKATIGSTTDTDFFNVVIPAGKTLKAVLTPNASSDYDLELYNAAGTLLVTLLGASAVIFIVLDLLPGNAAQVLLGPDASEQAIDGLAELGEALHRPCLRC